MKKNSFLQKNTTKISFKYTVFILIFIFLQQSCGIRYAEKKFAIAQTKKPYDAIIVPGYPFEGNHWNDVMKMRVLWSVYLYKQGFTKKIIFSGAAVYTPYTESEIMKMYAEKLGIPDSCILVESKAEHSVENLYFSNILARNSGLKKIAMASDPFQSKMIKGFRRRYKLDVDFIPANFNTLDTMMGNTDPTIDFQKAFVPNFIPITERHSKWQRFRGTLGHNLKKFKN